MRSSKIKSPNHFDKICDISVESIIQLYNNSGYPYKSNLFAYIIDNKLTIFGYIKSDNHYSDLELFDFIIKNINIDMDIKFEFLKSKLVDDNFIINTDTFLGYCCNENPEGIPFEHLETLRLSKYLYDKIKTQFDLALTINGKNINVFVETEHKKRDDILDIINTYIDKSENYEEKNITIEDSKNIEIYKSGMNFVSNFYGPRVPYSNTNFIGTDIKNNYRYSHLVARDIAKKFLIEQKLNYCLVELTYHSNKEFPIQIGIKGNNMGIHIENGTFFEYSSDYDMYSNIKADVIKNINETTELLIDFAKWGLDCS